jgi:hypothetical protein
MPGVTTNVRGVAWVRWLSASKRRFDLWDRQARQVGFALGPPVVPVDPRARCPLAPYRQRRTNRVSARPASGMEGPFRAKGPFQFPYRSPEIENSDARPPPLRVSCGRTFAAAKSTIKSPMRNRQCACPPCAQSSFDPQLVLSHKRKWLRNGLDGARNFPPTHARSGAAARSEHCEVAGNCCANKKPRRSQLAGAKRGDTDWSACMKNRHRVSQVVNKAYLLRGGRRRY